MLGLLALGVLAIPVSALAEEAVNVTVTVTGTGESERDALDDALRKAVEKGGGVEVTSRTETLDSAVAFDRIVTRAQGYVAAHKVIEKKKKWDLWRVTVEATIDRGKIKSDWGQIQMLLERKGRPTVMVLVKETVFDKKGRPQQSMTDFAATEIEKLLISKGFRLKSATGLKEIERRNRDAAVAANDLDSLASIARSYGANVMIIGNSTCRWSGAGHAHGVDLVHYRAAVSITAYNSDTGDLILSNTMEDKGAGLGEFKAITLAFKRTAEKISEDVLKRLLSRWYFEFQHGANLSVIVTITADDAKGLRKGGKMAIRFQEAVKGIEGVKDVRMNSYDKQSEKALANFTVETTLSVEALRNKLLVLDTEGAGFELEWTGSDKNTLRFNMFLD
jgi:metal-sulfur cluster biosynthetic enzyme